MWKLRSVVRATRTAGTDVTARAVIICLSDPDGSSHGGTLRLRAHRRALEALGYEVEFAFPAKPLGGTSPVSDATDSKRMRLKRSLGVLKRHLLPMPTSWGARDKSLLKQLGQTRADLVVLTALSQRKHLPRGANFVWIDFMDLWSEVARREARARRSWAARLTARMQARHLERAEARLGHSAQLVTTAGWEDHVTLDRRGVMNDWLPVVLPAQVFQTSLPPATERNVGFLGNFEYWPNIDAYRVLVANWLPALSDAGWTVVVAGRHTEVLGPPPAGVDLLGYVENVEDFYRRVSATLAPIRLGGGVKVKVIESLAHGRPVVGTSIAFEGLDPELRSFLPTVAEKDPDFSELNAGALTLPPADVLAPYSDAAAVELLRARLGDKTDAA